ncbi:hypothetical protein CDL12_12514 [Handroanthus impetiginosus]|uniref:Glycine-rich protein n=1 Tax=Handroanthus impetiginosus TaxID=429701 RepID=A0A2G9HBH6_9LAMI|nr:hypothetical protein CDL12_12514 [Handroanthus impetiginosus]
MRSKKRLLFLIIAFLCFCIHRPATAKVFPLVRSQESIKEKATKDHQESSVNKLGHGGGGANGHDPSPSGGDTNGGSHGAGASVIPLYAAGAGNNHHYHHGGGNRKMSRMEHVTLIITAFACFALCIHKD